MIKETVDKGGKTLKEYWSALAKELVPYVPGEQPKALNLIKLNTNENPYPPSPRVMEAVHHITAAELRLYPDPEYTALRGALARRHGVKEQMIFAGNGSDEVLAFCFQAFFGLEQPVSFADITYSFYKVYASLFHIPSQIIPLNEQFEIMIDDYLEKEGGVVLTNPNAPTGLALPLQEIERLLQDKMGKAVVIVDEAYVEFGAESAISLTEKYDNLLVVKTFSKSHSLAGMRVGYAIGNENLIEALNCVKNSFNSYTLDRMAQAAGIAAIEDEEYCKNCTGKIVHTREWTIRSLREMGFEVLESKTNFVFATHPTVKATEILKKLREKGIIVRHFQHPRIENYLRITIGTDEEMERFLEETGRIVS